MSEPQKVRALWEQYSVAAPRKQRSRRLLSPRTAAALRGTAWGLLLLVPVVVLLAAFVLAFQFLDRYLTVMIGGK
jgi:ferric-dicitrate binding protein FerR (iron transport regulator)